MGRRLWYWFQSTVLGGAYLASVVPALAASDAEFRKLLANPDDPELNRQYAISAEARGELRHALAALDRALAAQPDDQRIIAEYDRVRRMLLPATTLVTVQAGTTYATNPRQVPNGDVGKQDDVIIDGAVSLEDERTIAGWRIRSLAYAAGQWNTEASDISTFRMAAHSGPVVMLSRESWVHVAPGVSAEWLDDKNVFTEASAAVTFGTVFMGLTQSLTVRYGLRVGGDNSHQVPDGQTMEVLGRFVMGSALVEGDYAYFQPSFRLSDTFDDKFGTQLVYDETTQPASALTLVTRDISPFSYKEWGGRLSYFLPLNSNRSAYFGAGISVFNRDYDTFALDPLWLAGGALIATSDKRNDVFLEPTAHLIFMDLIAPNVDLRFDYRFEYNTSNDSSREFQDHVAGVRMVGRF